MMSKWRGFILVGAMLFAGQVLGQNEPPLVAAAKDADWNLLATLLKDGLNPDVVYGDGSSALHWSSYHNDLASAKLLLDAGADVNITTDLGVTPLWLAAENANAEMTSMLLHAGANPAQALLSGETIVMTAAQTGNAEVVRQLLVAGADPNTQIVRGQTALMWAANNGHSAVVATLLEYGADIHARTVTRTQYVKTEKPQDSPPDYKTWVEQGGTTPLMFSARVGDLDSVIALVKAGSDVNATSSMGISPAIMAVNGGNALLLQYLLENGARADDETAGHTALHAAVLRGNYAAVKVLLDHGASVDPILKSATPVRRQSTDYHFHQAMVGATPLWLAARFTEPKIMQLLLEHGANVRHLNLVSFPAEDIGENFIENEGDISVLMAATGLGHRRMTLSWNTAERRAGQIEQDTESLILESVRLAVEAGVDINLQDAAGRSALDYAKTRRFSSVVAYLESVGAEE